jgi:beta-glucosidase
MSENSEFHWGVSTSAFQTEGAIHADGKGASIWDIFSLQQGKIANKHHAIDACDFYRRYNEDLLLMSHMNITNFRFSIAWSRIFPHGIGKINMKGLDHYDRIVDSCLENNINPWITLYHWDLPYHLEEMGGWTNRDITYWFEEYIDAVVRRLKDRVKHWMVLNEPMVFTGAGYFLGIHAPGQKGVTSFLKALHHTAICQAQGIKQIQSLTDQNTEVGTTFSCSMISPFSELEKDVTAARKTDALLNRLFIEPLIGRGYPIKDLPFLSTIEKYFKPNDNDLLQASPDFIGIQNYTREVVKYQWNIPFLKAKVIPANKRNVAYTEMNWEIYPPSLYHVLNKFNEYPEIKKIYVTENGAAFIDEIKDGMILDFQRRDFINDCINQVLLAKKDGIRVDGYFVWSFTDNFEWAEGYKPRFGLVHVDFETQQRIIKESGKWYAKFLQDQKSISQEYSVGISEHV